MDSNRWQKIQEIFDAAAELDAAEQAIFLREKCAGDEALFHEIQSLLAADSQPHSLMESQIAKPELPLSPKEFAGEIIGSYKLVKLIGHGGMGSVYLAERADGQFEQQVALKLIRPGLNSTEILRRFWEERQILARLQHPNIARLLDGGVTENKLPYFTLEYVDGEPVDTYCDRRKLTVDQRLPLFLEICDAVQFAHRNLVIHRDLKPGNILVTRDGKVKLLDFGIAKVFGSEDDGESGALTQTGQHVLTPEYASPEQVRGEAVTTASDIYALGMVLYELLSGFRAYKIATRSMAEMERIICSTEPAKPSTTFQPPVAKVTDDHLPDTQQIATARNTNPEKLRRRLSGDLDNICLMALRKEPERRYASVDQFAQDIQRHLNGLPVIARPDTLQYRTQKFVRRHRLGIAFMAILLLVATALTAFYTAKLTHQRDIAVQEARKSEQITRFLTNLFEVADPGESKGRTVTASELLHRGAARIDTELANQPASQAAIQQVIGEVYLSLGLYSEGLELLEKSLATRRKLPDQETPELAKCMISLASALLENGEYPEAEKLLNEAKLLISNKLGDTHYLMAFVVNHLARSRNQQGDFAGAEPLYRQALRIWEQNGQGDSLEASIVMNNLGLLLDERGQYLESEAMYRAAVDIQTRVLGDLHPEITTTMFNLGQLLHKTGKYAAAEEMLLQVVENDRKMLGESHPYLAFDLNSLARVSEVQGNYAVAESLYLRALDIRREALGAEHPDVIFNLNVIGKVLQLQGKYHEANNYYRRALRVGSRFLGEDHPERAHTLRLLSANLMLLDSLDAAEKYLDQVEAIDRKVRGTEHPVYGVDLYERSRLLTIRGDVDKAAELIQRSLEIYRKTYGPEHVALASTMLQMGKIALKQGKVQLADSVFRESLQIYSNKLGAENEQVGWLLMARAQTALAANKVFAAGDFITKGLAILQKRLLPEHPRLLHAQLTKACWLIASGDNQSAEILIQQTQKMLAKQLSPRHRYVREAEALAAEVSVLATQTE